ncbi:hypothetical protein GE107_03365 [Cohnella sp. CFH 77786]|uniref:InlB B-repeat-containing protein n=1 Tax=Cohnella sp. CFH 77786 TaxID=2662265 RepID=UPI001C60BB3B|nr:InlB B-repeat-containing protein [Cohnella sp. CFH 77786]MBW5445103.1 hypothetical protein [Cohnella sp. CFH 77786]
MTFRKSLIQFMAFILVILPFLGHFSGQASAATSRVAVIKELKGTVQVKKAGGSKQFKAFARMSLNEGDVLTTGAGSSAVLQFANGTSEDDKMSVSANTTLTFSKLSDRKGTRTKVSMFNGSAWVDVKSIATKNDEFTLETPTAIMGVRGTHLLVSVDPVSGSTFLTVAAGVVSTQTTDHDNPDRRDVYPTENALISEDSRGDKEITIAPVDLELLMDQSDKSIVEAIVRAAGEIIKENNQKMDQYIDQYGNDSSSEQERRKKNIENLLGAIVGQAVDSGVISQERVNQLVKEVQEQTGITVDLKKDELQLTDEERLKQEEQRRKEEEARRAAEERRAKEEEERAKNEELLKKLETERNALHQANELTEEQKKAKALSGYLSQLSETEKERFERDQAASQPSRNPSANGNQSSGSSSDPSPSSAPSNDATLSGLSMTNANGNVSVALSPTFASGTTDYSTRVANSVDSVKLMLTANESHATIKVNGAAVQSGLNSSAINLNVGSNTISIVVTAQNGTTKTYTVKVTRVDLQTAGSGSPITVSNDPVSIFVPANVTDASIAVSTTMIGDRKTATLPLVEVQASTSLGEIGLTIPAGTMVSGPAGWDGIIQLPRLLAAASVPVTGGNVSAVIEVGSSNDSLIFDKAVRLLIPGQGGKSAGFVRAGQFNEITTTLTADSQAVADGIGNGGDAKITAGSDLAIWTKHFTQFVSYTPIVSIPKYKVTFESNGGSAIESQTVNHGGIAMEPTAPTKSGYSFAGWYQDTELTIPFIFSMTPITGTITLYAKWTKNSYTVTFESNGGSVIESQTVNHGGIAVEPTAPTKSGYSFAGWYQDIELTIPFVFSTTPITGNITLYAKWMAEGTWGVLSSINMQYYDPTATGGFRTVGPDMLAFDPVQLAYPSFNVPANGLLMKVKPVAQAGSVIRSVAVNGTTVSPDTEGIYGLSLSQISNSITVGVRLSTDPTNSSLVYYTFQVYRSILPDGLTDWTTRNDTEAYVEWEPSGVNTFQSVLQNYSEELTLDLYGIDSAVVNYEGGTVNSVPYSDRQRLVLSNLPTGIVYLSLTMYDTDHNVIGAPQTLILQNGILPKGIAEWYAVVDGADVMWHKVKDSDRYYVSVTEATYEPENFKLKLLFQDSSTTSASLYRSDGTLLGELRGEGWLYQPIGLDEGVNHFVLKTVVSGQTYMTDLVVVRDDTEPVLYDNTTFVNLKDISGEVPVPLSLNVVGSQYSAQVNTNKLALSFTGYPSEDIILTLNGIRLMNDSGTFNLTDHLNPGLNMLVATVYSNYSFKVEGYNYYFFLDYVPDDLKLTELQGATVTEHPSIYQSNIGLSENTVTIKPVTANPSATVSVMADGETVIAKPDGSYDIHVPPGLTYFGVIVKVQYGGQEIYYNLEVYRYGGGV